MIQKRILVPDRVRRLPRTDWAWVDRRFLRDFAPKLSGDAVFLYYLLIAVSDKNGLSFYGDNSLAQMIRTPQGRLLQARQELVDWNLIAYDSPLTQVLALPSRSQRNEACNMGRDSSPSRNRTVVESSNCSEAWLFAIPSQASLTAEISTRNSNKSTATAGH